MGGQITTEKDEEYLEVPQCQGADWRKWIRYNLKNTMENDLFFLMKSLFEKMKARNKPKIFKDTFSKMKFLKWVLTNTHDIAALAYFYKEASEYFPESQDIPKEFAKVVDIAIKQFEDENLRKAFIYYPKAFENLEKISENTLEYLRIKIRCVFETLGQIDSNQLEWSNSKVDMDKVWIFWLAVYEDYDHPINELKFRKILVELALDDLAKNSVRNYEKRLFGILNTVIFPLMATRNRKIARKLTYFVCSNYLKKEERYFPDPNQALQLVQNLLNENFCLETLKYVKKLMKYFIQRQEWKTLEKIGKKYLYSKLILNLTSEMHEKSFRLLKLLIQQEKIEISKEKKFESFKKLKTVIEYLNQFPSKKQRIKKVEGLLSILEEERKVMLPKTGNNLPKGNTNLPIKGSIEKQPSKKIPDKHIYAEFEKDLLNVSRICGTENIVVPFRGFLNIGQNCYMISLLQSLYFTPGLRYFLLTSIRERKEKQPLVIKQMMSLFEQLNHPFRNNNRPSNMLQEPDPVNPIQFKRALRPPYNCTEEQQDVFLFAGVLFEQIRDAYKSPDFKNEARISQESMISHLFTCQFKSKVKCLDCGTISSSHDDLQWMIMINLSITNKRDLTQMIKESLKPESMEKTINCETCNKISEKTEKATYMKRLPPYLIIALNLTKFNHQREETVKILEIIRPPMNMSIDSVFNKVSGEEAKETANYELYSIIIHKGFYSDYGHYFTIARNLDLSELNRDDSWFIFNDDKVVKIGKQLDLTKILEKLETPYLFFFENKGRKDFICDIETTIRF